MVAGSKARPFHGSEKTQSGRDLGSEGSISGECDLIRFGKSIVKSWWRLIADAKSSVFQTLRTFSSSYLTKRKYMQ